MVLSHKLITNNYSRALDDKNIILLILIHLHIEKKINDAQLKALFKNYRKGILHRYVKTYHCSINDKWYNDEPMLEVFFDIYNDIPNKDLTVEQVLPYLNLLLNKNKNYCIDFIYKQFFEPTVIFMNIFSDSSIDFINSFKLGIDIPTYSQTTDLGSGYCCEDHDGDYEEYKRRNYEYVVSRDLPQKLKDKAKSFLQSKKTASSYKNLNNILL